MDQPSTSTVLISFSSLDLLWGPGAKVQTEPSTANTGRSRHALPSFAGTGLSLGGPILGPRLSHDAAPAMAAPGPSSHAGGKRGLRFSDFGDGNGTGSWRQPASFQPAVFTMPHDAQEVTKLFGRDIGHTPAPSPPAPLTSSLRSYASQLPPIGNFPEPKPLSKMSVCQLVNSSHYEMTEAGSAAGMARYATDPIDSTERTQEDEMEIAAQPDTGRRFYTW